MYWGWVESKWRTSIYVTFQEPETSWLSWTVNTIVVAAVLISAVTFCLESIRQYEKTVTLMWVWGFRGEGDGGAGPRVPVRDQNPHVGKWGTLEAGYREKARGGGRK